MMISLNCTTSLSSVCMAKSQELYEVLLRLSLIEGRQTRAGEFIEHAATLKMMADIDKWVIRTAFENLISSIVTSSRVPVFSSSYRNRPCRIRLLLTGWMRLWMHISSMPMQ